LCEKFRLDPVGTAAVVGSHNYVINVNSEDENVFAMPAHVEAGVGDAAGETKAEKKLVQLLVPKSRTLPEAINSLDQLADLAGGAVEATGRRHVDLLVLRENAVKESGGHVEVKEVQVFSGGDREQISDRTQAERRGERLVEVHTRGLRAANRAKSGLVAHNLASFAPLQLEDPSMVNRAAASR
jgi:hypothetical protein